MPAIFFENSQYFVLDKEHGLNTEPDSRGHPNLMEWLKAKRPESYKRWGPHPLHRLDRPVSGLLLVAKSLAVHRVIQPLFEKKQITKIYRALVHGYLPNDKGMIEHFHTKDTLNFRAVLSEVPTPGSQMVRLTYSVIARYNAYTSLDIRLYTGRYHQIRAQLAAMGHPIVGDELYGAEPATFPHAIALRAYKLGFTCPFEKKKVLFESLPEDYDSKWISEK